MDTPAGGNGRSAGPGSKAIRNGAAVGRAPGGGRPTCDEVYARLTDDLLRRLDLDRDESFAAAVARRFKEGPARVCCRAIGAWVDRRLLDFGWTQQELADRVGVDRSAVARWTAGGAISLGHLVLVLIEFQGDFADLPVPAREELALEGYLAALALTRDRLGAGESEGVKSEAGAGAGAGAAGQGAVDPLDREGFWCLYHLFSEPYWERAVRRKDREQLKAEAERIFRRAAESLGRAPRRVRSVEGLRKLVDDWALAWVVCLNLLPRSWSV